VAPAQGYTARKAAAGTLLAERGGRPAGVLIRGLEDPGEWDLPPKPKWMRWRTYQRYVDKYDRYEAVLDQGTFALVERLMGRT